MQREETEDSIIASRAMLCIQLEKFSLSAVVEYIFYPFNQLVCLDPEDLPDATQKPKN